jgi:hypothetical protein
MNAPTLDADQTLTPAQELAMARRQHNAKYPTRPFEPPLARLLRIANDLSCPHRVQVAAAAAALPFYHQQVVALPTTIDLPPLDDVPAILRAQQLVTEALARGTLEINAGQALMNALALMIRSLEATTVVATERTLAIIGGLPDLPLPTDDTANPNHQPPPEGAQAGATYSSRPTVQASVL